MGNYSVRVVEIGSTPPIQATTNPDASRDANWRSLDWDAGEEEDEDEEDEEEDWTSII